MEAEEKAHHCLVRLSATDDVARVRADGLELTSGPAQPDSRGEWWLAEELLIAALSTSLLSTFREQARREGLAVGAYSCVGEAIVHEARETPLSRVVLRVEVEAASEDLPRLDGVLRQAKHACVLARALAVPLELQLTPMPSGASFALHEPRSR